MNNIIFTRITNSQAIYEPFTSNFKTGTSFSGISHSLQETQSASVTENGSLWQQTLAQLAYESPHISSKGDFESNKLPQNAT